MGGQTSSLPKIAFTLAAVLVLASRPAPAAACSFCPGTVTQSTLRERFAEAKAVVLGTLKNPTFTNDTGAGSTEFHFDRVLKANAVIEKRTSVVIPRYVPVIGKTPPAYLMFFDSLDGKPDAVFGVPATEAVAKYVAGVTALDPKRPGNRLAFYFDHLDSAETAIAEDAFQEFAKTPDADILAARAVLSPTKLDRLLLDPKTPPHRIGVFALMLGLCGGEAHSGTFAKLLQPPLSDAVSGNLGGVLAGYAVCSPKAGWTTIRATVADGKQPFAHRLSAMQAVRFFQATRPKESRAIILDTYRLTLPDADLADIAIDDLRRWGWWDLSAEVLALYAKPTHAAPVFKKGIVRYALTCPEPLAKRFVDGVRKTEPKLVADVEDGLKLVEEKKD